MAYKKGQDRRQRVLFPDCIDEYVEADAPVRLFDAFVDNLKMNELGFVRSTPAETGTPGYDPRDLLKLYIYGYFYQVRSSRKLARECKCNVEVMWLLNKLTPDFRTISDFRKDNKKAITKVFKEFNKFCMGLKLFSKSYISIDGSKFKAVNAKDNNLTLSKLDDRIKRLDEHISIYMEELEAYDHEEGRKLSKDELQRKLDVCKERKERYEGYRDTLEKSGESQISLTDPDSRLMKANEGFCVGYNVQTAVDAESHMIAGFLVTNSPTDHGQLTSVASEVKADYGVDVLESTADKGYECPEDHADALANGIVPNVIQRDGSCTEQVQFLRGGHTQFNVQAVPVHRVLHLRDVVFQLDDLVALFAVLFHRCAFQRVVLVQHSRRCRRVSDAIAGIGDEVRLHLHRTHMGDDDTGGHDGVQRVLPLSKVRVLGLRLNVHALALALLPQRKRAGKGHVDVGVEAQRVPHRQAAALEHPLHHPLQIQQGDVGGLILFLKRDSDCNQSRDLLTDDWHRSHGRRGCRAGWSGRQGPCCTPAPDIRGSHRSPCGSTGSPRPAQWDAGSRTWGQCPDPQTPASRYRT